VLPEVSAIPEQDAGVQLLKQVLEALTRSATVSDSAKAAELKGVLDLFTPHKEAVSQWLPKHAYAWEGGQFRAQGGNLVRRALDRIEADLFRGNEPVQALQTTFALAAVVTTYDEQQKKTLKNVALEVLKPKAMESKTAFNPEKPWEALYRKATAGNAAQLLERARRLLESVKEEVPRELRRELALAVNPASADPEIAQLLEPYLPEDRAEEIPVLIAKAHAQASDFEGCKTAFESYAAILPLVEKNPKVTDAERHEKVLEPALEKGEDALKKRRDGGFAKQVGGLFVVKARLLKKGMPQYSVNLPVKLDEMLHAYKRAVELGSGSAIREELSREYHDWGVQSPTDVQHQDYLRQALKIINPAIQEVGAPASTYAAQGKALEEIAYFLGEKPKFAKAIDAYDEAIKKEGEQTRYLIGRGRCSCKRAIAESKPNYFSDARKDLQAALAKGPADDQKLEAHLWLGLSYLKDIKPNYSQLDQQLTEAVRLASGDESILRLMPFWLEALAEWGKLSIERAKEETDPKAKSEYLDKAVKCHVDLGNDAKRAGNEQQRFYAANVLQYIGETFYENPARPEPLKALQIYQKGLPKKVEDAEFSQVHLLYARNSLLAWPPYQDALKNYKDKPTPEQLVKDATKGLELAMSDQRWPIFQAEAHEALGLCYLHAGKKEKGREYLNKALEFNIEPMQKKKIEEKIEKFGLSKSKPDSERR
jgi:tetratricopeptide (TPR) repeat protein